MRPSPPASAALFACLLACAPTPETAEGDGAAEAPATQPLAPADSAAAAAAVQDVVDRFLTAFNAGDAAQASSIYAEDIVQLRPDGPPLRGRDATVSAVQEFLDQFATAPTQTAATDEVIVRGDLAVASGTWALTTALDTGSAADRTGGKWLMVMRRQGDGSWQVSRWIWNQEAAGGGADAGP